MAEGFARALHGGRLRAVSAGTRPKEVDPRAVAVMREVGIEIEGGRGKRPEDVAGMYDVVVTVCEAAAEECPRVAGASVIRVPFDDPPRLAEGSVSEEEALAHYRRVRDEIRAFVEALPEKIRRLGGKGSVG